MTKKRLCIISAVLAALILCIYLIYAFIDNSVMLLELNGDETIVLTYNTEYQEFGVTPVNIDGYKEENLKISSSLNISKVGTYTVYYEYKVDDKIITTKRNIIVIDNIEPVITLKGEENVNINLDKTYKEPGYTAHDEYYGDLKDKVIVEGDVDTSKVGTYPITYSVTDTSGNKTSVTRTVTVKDPTPPTLTLKDAKMFIAKGSKYVEAGYTASDNYDGDITDKVTVNNPVDTSKTGSYIIEYKVKDSSGNEVTATRRINVYDNTSAKKYIYLTFDDGPSSLTPKILEILKEKGVKATFFVSPNSNTYSYLNSIVDDGHELALHGFHEYKKLYASKEDFFYYFDKVQNRIKEETGITVRNFRFPGGSSTVYLKRSILDEIKAEFKTRGIVYYDWNVDSQDASGKYMSKEAIANTVINQVTSSSRKENVILMHDLVTKTTTKDALPEIIDTFLEMGYEFKTIDECSFAPQFR